MFHTTILPFKINNMALSYLNAIFSIQSSQVGYGRCIVHSASRNHSQHPIWICRYLPPIDSRKKQVPIVFYLLICSRFNPKKEQLQDEGAARQLGKHYTFFFYKFMDVRLPVYSLLFIFAQLFLDLLFRTIYFDDLCIFRTSGCTLRFFYMDSEITDVNAPKTFVHMMTPSHTYMPLFTGNKSYSLHNFHFKSPNFKFSEHKHKS